MGEAPSTLRHGRHGCASRGGSRRGGREAGGGGGPRGGRRGGERPRSCEMFLKVPQELLDPDGGPGGEHKECALPVLQRAELESRAQSRPVLWGPEAGPELSPVGNTRLVEEQALVGPDERATGPPWCPAREQCEVVMETCPFFRDPWTVTEDMGLRATAVTTQGA